MIRSLNDIDFTVPSVKSKIQAHPGRCVILYHRGNEVHKRKPGQTGGLRVDKLYEMLIFYNSVLVFRGSTGQFLPPEYSLEDITVNHKFGKRCSTAVTLPGASFILRNAEAVDKEQGSNWHTYLDQWKDKLEEAVRTATNMKEVPNATRS